MAKKENEEGLTVKQRIKRMIDSGKSRDEIIKYVKEECQGETLSAEPLGWLCELYLDMDPEEEFCKEIQISDLIRNIHHSFGTGNGNNWARMDGVGYLGSRYHIEHGYDGNRNVSITFSSPKNNYEEESQNDSLNNPYEYTKEKFLKEGDDKEDTTIIPALKLDSPNFLNYLNQKNFFFDIKTIENYLLSLKVKPFVILTGPSGTGKTKIAQKFAEYKDEYVTIKTRYSKLDTNEENGDYFFLGKGTISKLLDLSKYAGTADFYFDGIKSNESINLDIRATCDDKKVVEHLKTINDLSNVEIQILKKDLTNTFFNEELEKESILSFEPNVGKSPEWCIPRDSLKNFLPVKNEWEWNARIDGIETTIKFWVHDVFTRVSLSKNEELKKHIEQKEKTEKLKIKVNLNSFKCNDNENYDDVEIEGDFRVTENYKIIPVGANWTDNRNIFGFYNVITKKYQTTPALDLILETKKSSAPHFLILDEMNLSHIERYFADFLSAIESKEDIPLYSENNVSEEELNIPPNLPIPKNLFVIGTVNVDETTYMFSPKVLDRANVLEFESFSEDFSIADFMRVEESDNSNVQKFNINKISYLENPLMDSDILEKPMNILKLKLSKIEIPKDDGEKNISLWMGLSEQLESINKILKPAGFDLGFRAVKEILSFMYVAYKYESFDSESKDWKFDWERYLDAQIKQKILPKIHGSKKVLGNTLDELLVFCLSDNMVGEDKDLPNVNEITKDNTIYYSSAKKIAEMREVLENQRYVSFIN